MAKAAEGEIVEVLAESVDKFGRPSKLTPELIKKAWEYLNNTTSIAVNAGGLLPTKERLALTLGVSRQTLDNWAEKSPDFLDIYNSLDVMQADMLVQNGLVGRYTPAITAIMLSRHNYVRKTEEDITSGGEKLEAGLSASQAEQLIRARAIRDSSNI